MPKAPDQLTPLIDGDIIVYSAGFAAQTKGIVQPVQNALSNAKHMLGSIFEVCGEPEEGKIYLTGKDNYRIKAAITHPYKGNRKSDKPEHYTAIREYLINVWGAIVIDGMEADDAMGINQTEETCICTIDKDLDMIMGWHYNWRKGKKYWVTQEEADYSFHLQMLTGDAVDNIKGIRGVGPKKAEKVLVGLDFGERLIKIKEMYQSHFGDAWKTRYYENEKLLWILREPL